MYFHVCFVIVSERHHPTHICMYIEYLYTYTQVLVVRMLRGFVGLRTHEQNITNSESTYTPESREETRAPMDPNRLFFTHNHHKFKQIRICLGIYISF